MPNEPDNDDLEAFEEYKLNFGSLDFQGDDGFTLSDAYNMMGIPDPFQESDGV